MAKIRVLVVEDSPTVRERILETLGADAELEVVGAAEDGKSAIELCRRLRPDAVTLDMMLPVMTGLSVTEYLMAYCPTPILIVSSSTNRGEVFKTYDALAAGAVDVFEKPTGEEPDGQWEAGLIARVKLVSRIKVISHPRGRLQAAAGAARAVPGAVSLPPAGKGLRAVAIGASTGGPGAVVEILKNLPRGFPHPILLVIHLAKAFGPSFAEWLNTQSPLPVSFAADGDALPVAGRGQVIMAPPDRHLILSGGRLRLTAGPERNYCRPSVDVLFESLAAELGAACAACLLTGMGRDGAEGLLAIRRAGGVTMAQDENSSVVFGMPKEAAALGAAQHILSLEQFAPALTSLSDRSMKQEAR